MDLAYTQLKQGENETPKPLKRLGCAMDLAYTQLKQGENETPNPSVMGTNGPAYTQLKQGENETESKTAHS